jgi:hypothetical protein
MNPVVLSPSEKVAKVIKQLHKIKETTDKILKDNNLVEEEKR